MLPKCNFTADQQGRHPQCIIHFNIIFVCLWVTITHIIHIQVCVCAHLGSANFKFLFRIVDNSSVRAAGADETDTLKTDTGINKE